MQVVKNLFLWPSKSYVRKAIEIPLTYAIELAWPKRRILEIYLNIAEWGPGVFGAEAAARYHFGKPAAALTPSQAALLAVSLPNPIERRAGAPGPGTLRLANDHARAHDGQPRQCGLHPGPALAAGRRLHGKSLAMRQKCRYKPGDLEPAGAGAGARHCCGSLIFLDKARVRWPSRGRKCRA